MVAVLLRLRFRVLANTLRRNTWQLVAVVLGGVQALVLVAAVFGGLLIASTAPPGATQAVVVVGGAALMLGWVIVPLLFDGVEQTLDPLKLARFPLRTGQLMSAMFLVGITWVPGIATIIVAVGTAVAWRIAPAVGGGRRRRRPDRRRDVHRRVASDHLGRRRCCCAVAAPRASPR